MSSLLKEVTKRGEGRIEFKDIHTGLIDAALILLHYRLQSNLDSKEGYAGDERVQKIIAKQNKQIKTAIALFKDLHGQAI